VIYHEDRWPAAARALPSGLAAVAAISDTPKLFAASPGYLQQPLPEIYT
jgi:hypothetical protein